MDRLPDVAFIKPTPYQSVMDVWAKWFTLSDMAREEMGGYMHPQDLKEFMATGEAVSAMLGDLPRHLWWAVWKQRGFCTCWNFPSVNLVDALQQAEDILTEKMKKHVATARYFR